MALRTNKAKALEKMFRSKFELEKKRGHSQDCRADGDPEYYGPCSPFCTSSSNWSALTALDDAIEVLLESS